MFRPVLSTLLLLIFLCPGALLAQARQGNTSSTSHNGQHRPPAATKRKQAPRNLQETYCWPFPFKGDLYTDQGVITVQVKQPDGSVVSTPIYDYASDHSEYRLSLSTELTPDPRFEDKVPPLQSFFMNTGHLVAFIPGFYEHDFGYKMVVFDSLKRPRPIYFSSKDIADPTIPGVSEFFHDPYLFTPGTSMETYTKGFDALQKKLLAPDDIVSLPTDRDAIRERLKIFIANAFNDIIYNQDINLFLHPIIKKEHLAPQIVMLYKDFLAESKKRPAQPNDEKILSMQRMLNREIIFYLLPRRDYAGLPPKDFFQPSILAKAIAWEKDISMDTSKAVEENGQIVLYDRNNMVIARFDPAGPN